jgi:hypothetical protein
MVDIRAKAGTRDIEAEIPLSSLLKFFKINLSSCNMYSSHGGKYLLGYDTV